jgi:hypothetical protein
MHQDPWKIFLARDPDHLIILGQQPNYLPELYILLLPLGLMSFSTAVVVWTVVSLALSVAILCLTAKTYDLTATQALICAEVFLASTPLRVSLANGQQITLVFALLVAAFYCNKSLWKGLWLGLSYCKYSFAPVIFLTWLLDRRYLLLFCSVLPPVIGLLGVYYLVHSPLPDLILGPIRTAEIVFNGSYGFGDIMSLAKLFADRFSSANPMWQHLPEIVVLAGSLIAAIYLRRLKSMSESRRAALMITLTLLLFRHIIYDFVALLLPFATAFDSRKTWTKAGVFTIVTYFWFGSSIVNRLAHWPSIPVLSANCLALMTLSWLITLL